jgi:hypothetical protein
MRMLGDTRSPDKAAAFSALEQAIKLMDQLAGIDDEAIAGECLLGRVAG